MKKRLLITSIVMMLVVAVALSTATYAWFTSNATVTANSISMTATTNTAPTIGISWTNGNYTTEISPTITENLTFAPVAPATLSTSGTITDSTVVFKTGEAYSSNGVYKFKANGADPAATATYTWADNNSHNSFWVKNLSEANALVGNLTLTATITGESENDGADLIRVGVFKNNGSGTFELLDVLANTVDTYTVVAENAEFTSGEYYKLVLGRYELATAGTAQQVTDGTADYTVGAQAPANTFYTKSSTQVGAKAVYGNITLNSPVNNMSTYTCATKVNVATNLAANTAIELKVIVWMDGAALGNNQQSKVASIKLDFAIEAPVAQG